MMCSQEPLHFPLPVFETRFTSTELDELLSFFQSSDNNNNNNSITVDDESSPQPLSSNSGSDDPTNGFGFGVDMDEKKKRRKISNRDSARRSRWRKKRHLEDLTAHVNRLKAQNLEHTNRLSLVLNQLRAVKTQNELMRFECIHLIQRHEGLNRVLQAMQYKDKITTTNNMNSERFVEGDGLSGSQHRHAY